MEAVLFAIPASDKLVRKTQQVVQRAPNASLEEMREVVREAGMQYVDDIVDGMVLTFVHGDQVGRITQSLLANLASVIKTVCHGIIHQAVANAGEHDLEAITEFFRARVLTTVRDGQKIGLIAYPPSHPQQELLQRVARANDNGGPAGRDDYLEVVRGIVDEAVHHHFEQPFSLLKLGFITRRAVDLGRRAILSTGHGVASRSIRHDSDAELNAISRFLRDSIVPASMCRPV